MSSSYTYKNQDNQLFLDIQNARNQINKLKQQADSFNNTKVQHSSIVKDYLGSVVYSLKKADHNVQNAYQEYKHKLPSISHKKQEQPLLNINPAYKKYKKNYKILHQNKQQQSTKLDSSFNSNNISFTIQNRPLKFHSHHEKHLKPQYSINPGLHQKNFIDFSIPQIDVSSRKSTGQSVMRKKRFINNQSKSIKYIDLNNSNKIQKNQKSAKQAHSSKNIYHDAVDKYSKHIFMIINGVLADQGPQYASYKRIYQSAFVNIKQNINRIEKMLKQYKINFARLDGKKLAYISLKDNPKNIQLIDCLQQSQQIKFKIFPKSKFQGRQGFHRAATLISACWKMYKTRKQYSILKRKVIILQDFFRRKTMQLQLQHKIRKRNTEIYERFIDRQQTFSKKWNKLKQSKRIQIHINSIQVDQQKRVTIENFSQRQNIQLSRIFRLKDENLIIIYISPNQLSFELINYYYRMLQLAGIQNYRDRLIFINPSDAEIFPNHFSSQKLLYYSSKTLKQLKIICADIPTIIIPGLPCNQSIKICDFLNCYLFSGQPQKMKQLTTKSQVRRFCSNLMIQTLPGAMQMYDYGQFMNTFAVLLLKNPQIQTWILKIDDQFAGRGIAYFEVNKSKYIQSIFKKINYGDNSQFFATDIATDPNNQQLTIQIRDYLKQKLSQKLKIATPTLYRTYVQFMGRFIKKGGVIQAGPPCLKQNIRYPSISFCLQPNGQYQIISTYQKIMGQPFRAIACTFPQKCLDIQIANTVIRQLCESFKLRKLFGFFTVDFVMYEKQKSKKSWVVDIDPYLNNFTASYFIFDTLMQGSFFPDKNMYLIEKNDETKSQTKSIQTTQSVSNKDLSTREYIFIPHFYNPNICKVKIKSFFKQARIQRFNFDIGNRQGTCIMLLDQLTSGVMGLLCVSQKKEHNIQTLKLMLQFVARISDVKNVAYGKSENLPATDSIFIKDVISVFSGITRKQQKKNVREKALKKHQLTCNLQMII